MRSALIDYDIIDNDIEFIMLYRAPEAFNLRSQAFAIYLNRIFK